MKGADFDYPINYSEAILDAREDGRLAILVKRRQRGKRFNNEENFGKA
jgi:hypothetical protein